MTCWIRRMRTWTRWPAPRRRRSASARGRPPRAPRAPRPRPRKRSRRVRERGPFRQQREGSGKALIMGCMKSCAGSGKRSLMGGPAERTSPYEGHPRTPLCRAVRVLRNQRITPRTCACCAAAAAAAHPSRRLASHAPHVHGLKGPITSCRLHAAAPNLRPISSLQRLHACRQLTTCLRDPCDVAGATTNLQELCLDTHASQRC